MNDFKVNNMWRKNMRDYSPHQSIYNNTVSEILLYVNI